MNLLEALATGKYITRPGLGSVEFNKDDIDNGDYLLSSEDVFATDYSVVDDSVTLDEASFARAWDQARHGFPSIKAAGTSEFYKALVAELFHSS